MPLARVDVPLVVAVGGLRGDDCCMASYLGAG
jgi:hypothetical protein